MFSYIKYLEWIDPGAGTGGIKVNVPLLFIPRTKGVRCRRAIGVIKDTAKKD